MRSGGKTRGTFQFVRIGDPQPFDAFGNGLTTSLFGPYSMTCDWFTIGDDAHGWWTGCWPRKWQHP